VAGAAASGGVAPGSPGGPAQGAPAPTPGQPAAPSPSGGPKAEIRFASLGVASGPLGAVIRPIPDAARAWSLYVNEHGGLAGHPVKLVVADDGGDPNRSLALAKQFVEKDKVQAFFGTHMITTEEVVTPYLAQKHVPIIGTCNCSAGNDNSPDVFFFGPSASKGLAWSHLAPLVELTKVKKVAFIYCREAQQCKGAADEAGPMAEKAGLRVVYRAQVSLAAPDYTAEVLEARNAGAEAIAVFADNQTAVRVIRSADRQGWKPAVSIQQSGYDSRMLALKETEGMYTSGIVPDYASDPRLADYRTSIQRVSGGVPAIIGAGTFVVGQLLQKLAPALPDDPTGGDFIRLMEGLRGETMGGLLPPITFRPGVGHEDTNRCVIPAVIHNGRFETPTGDRFVCAPGWKPVAL
jgi:branched-chain amino acid transport system substrate-binding protein